jgi:hypothetical protein
VHACQNEIRMMSSSNTPHKLKRRTCVDEDGFLLAWFHSIRLTTPAQFDYMNEAALTTFPDGHQFNPVRMSFFQVLQVAVNIYLYFVCCD